MCDSGDFKPAAAQGRWEQRWHPLRREWVVYAAHRDTRPWSGRSERPPDDAPAYDPGCYLCPGNCRSGGAVNPAYEHVYVFDNDFPVVSQIAPAELAPLPPGEAYQVRRADGIARVVCYSPLHNVTLTDLPRASVSKVFTAWREQTREFRDMAGVRFVLLFENKGELVGTSSPHPHCQLYATNFVFKNVERELQAAQDFRKEHDANVFAAILEAERSDGRRIIAENDNAIAFVPYCARYPYEAWIFPKRRHATFATMRDDEFDGLADVYLQLTRRYDLRFDMSFPYVMAVYQAPVDDEDHDEYHLHLVFFPPLRQPGLRKFPAGPEIGGGNFMCDTIPEDKAAELRAVDLTEFREKG